MLKSALALLLHLDLLLLLDLLNLDLFRDDLLLHDVGLDLVGFVGLGLLTAALLSELSLLDVEVALGFGLLSQSRIAAVLWVARLSQIRCTSSSAGTALSMATRNRRNSTARCRRCSSEITVPSAMLNAANRLVTPYR